MRLTAGQLTRMQAVQATAMPDTCAIVRAGASTSDGRGGRTFTRSTVGTVACRVASRSDGGYETLQESRLLANDRYYVTMPDGTDIRAGDRVVVNGRTLEVDGRTGIGSWETATRVACVERQP